METQTNVEVVVSELVSHTEQCSCDEFRIELPSNQKNPESFKLILVGKIISTRNFNYSVVRDIVTKAWNLSFLVSVKKVDKNLFLFTFQHEADLNMVFRRRPWTLRGAHLILKVWELNLNWNEIDFSKSTFWIQVHGLPSFWQNKPNLTRIGNKVGTVIEVDLIGEPPPRWFRFVRVRVEINISAPLSPSMFLPRLDLDDVWIGLKYEKLPDLCFICGIIGHDSNACTSMKKLITNSFGHKIPAFGPWMRSENEYMPPEIYAKPASSMTPPSTVVVGENTTTPPLDRPSSLTMVSDTVGTKKVSCHTRQEVPELQHALLDTALHIQPTPENPLQTQLVCSDSLFAAVGGTVQVCPSASTTVREPPITSFLPVGPG